jgi:acyl-coenzyme A synthetase/AMP-(fatty) acid ligase
LDGIGDEETKFHVDGTVWHRTGDAGCLDEEGALWLLGRFDVVVRDKHGELYPFAVECCALQCEWVERAACIAWEEERTLLVVPNRPVTAEQERELCKSVEWARLMHVLEARDIPLDRRHNAKVEYPQLHKKLRDYRYVRRLRGLSMRQ